MRKESMKCDWTAKKQNQLQQLQLKTCRRSKKRYKNKTVCNAPLPTTYNHSNYYNFIKTNKLLIAILLLITMTATTTICQAAAAPHGFAAASPTRILPIAAVLLKTTATTAATTSASLLSTTVLAALTPTQQKQQQLQQQQELFALLTKNRQTSLNGMVNSGFAVAGDGDGDVDAAAAAGIADAASSLTTSTSGTRDKFEIEHSKIVSAFKNAKDNIKNYKKNAANSYNNNEHHNVKKNADDDDDVVIAPAADTFLETTGFFADDGQKYEKADKAGIGSININDHIQHTNANNCPKECKCLNDFFDCGKKHLDHVPELPNYVVVLDMVGNKLNDTTVLQIKNLTSLNKLSLKRNQLENIPKFVGLSMLKQLNLANNHIQHISHESLTLLPKLRVLDMTKNYLHKIEISYFPATNTLAHLILNSNEISTIDENAFENLSNILDLELNNNRLTMLPGGVFKNLSKMRKLSLNYNHLEINWSTFKGLTSLQKLFLQSNNIRALQDGIFHVMRSIETIELDHNDITSLNRQGLFNLTKLQHLSLSNNSISRIELDTFEFTESLKSLDLSHNNISEFKPQHLDCLQHLKHLNLGHNKIQYLADNTFECVKNLEDLNLRRNKLAWIIEDQGAIPPFKALGKLKKLDLYGNNLKQINTKSLNGLNSLELLNLGGNALASIQTGAFDQMAHLQKVIFKSLNFICDCELLWFRRWLQRNAQTNTQIHANAVCGYPEHLLDREVLSLTQTELICADTPKPIIIEEPNNQLAVKGANITMECIAKSPTAASLAAADELKIKWRHDNHNIKDRNERVVVNGNHNGFSTTDTQILHEQSNHTIIKGYLRLYNVSYESAGKYQCVVSNAFGTTYSQKFKLSIGIHPTFLQIPSNLTIDSGNTARLVCSAAGDPMPEIALQKFGASGFPAATERRLKVVREENAFIITNAKPIDTGIYTCTADSPAGEIKINASLVVNDKPQPTIPVMTKEVVLGESSILECLDDVVADLNQPHREWYKDNKPFHTSPTSDSERYYYETEKRLLIIMNTQSIDAGNYRCEITDQLKSFVVQTELIVVQDKMKIYYVLLGVALLCCLILICVLICYLKCKQKRKLSNINIDRTGVGDGVNSGLINIGGARIAATNDSTIQQHLLNHSQGSTLDQTQLTTLNRTYLQDQLLHTHPRQQQHTHQMRPRSLADLDLSLNTNNGATKQRNYLLGNDSLNYQQLLQHDVDAIGNKRMEDVRESFTLEYLRQNSTQETEINQDYLSSKDSGTGSDAAVKRSIEDFSLLPQEEQLHILSTPTAIANHNRRNGRTILGNTNSYTENGDKISRNKHNTEEDEEDFVALRPLGVSDVYEVDEIERSEQERLFFNNNRALQMVSGMNRDICGNALNYEGDTINTELSRKNDSHPQQLPHLNNSKCKTNLSTNFNSNATEKAVDI
ncbi:leucine-rich repeats and immunoglobulin-like domains protein 3 [Teleopsis dalmanni]|uniref:leucine-rich repeats and immunoglobulin-like domains protein 3 n=1 Tax=Teleopsis dalmanni TaxID=139649 RepID=UPI0018CD4985|nr:leucine-rich repeats and immunoglobulin-like domains protein 3 [Teleopsis dalmanni]